MNIRIAALTVAALLAVGGAAGNASASPGIDYATKVLTGKEVSFAHTSSDGNHSTQSYELCDGGHLRWLDTWTLPSPGERKLFGTWWVHSVTKVASGVNKVQVNWTLPQIASSLSVYMTNQGALVSGPLIPVAESKNC
jgi:hypothetical protein